MKRFLKILLITEVLLFSACTEKTVNQLYLFGQTTDSGFCSKDSIVAGDCEGGVIYLTTKGNAIYSFWCIGQDSTSFSFGTYHFDNEKIVCVFNKCYSFYTGDKTDPSEYEAKPDSGVIYKVAPWIITLNKLKCPIFDYGFKTDNRSYVLMKADSEKSKIFFDDFNKIEALNKL
jgi:hypothetical protein